MDSGKIVIKVGDGRKGLKEFAPYDAIHVGAGRSWTNNAVYNIILLAATEVPKDLLDQLAPGGRMVITQQWMSFYIQTPYRWSLSVHQGTKNSL